MSKAERQEKGMNGESGEAAAAGGDEEKGAEKKKEPPALKGVAKRLDGLLPPSQRAIDEQEDKARVARGEEKRATRPRRPDYEAEGVVTRMACWDVGLDYVPPAPEGSPPVADPWRKLMGAIQTFRWAIRKMDGLITSVQAMGASADWYDPSVRVRCNTDMTHRLLQAVLGTKSARAEGYEMRDAFFKIVAENTPPDLPASASSEEVEAARRRLPPPYFASHVWDQARILLAAKRGVKLPGYKNLPRYILVVQGRYELIETSRMGLPILKAKSAMGNVKFSRDENGRRIIWVRWGEDADSATLVVTGLVRGREKPYQVGRRGNSAGIFDRLAAGDEARVELAKMEKDSAKREKEGVKLTREQEIELERKRATLTEAAKWRASTPTVNWNDHRKRWWVALTYTMPKSEVKGIEADNVLEVCFAPRLGKDLPLTRAGRSGKNDQKMYVIHGFFRPKKGQRRKWRIAVNHVVDRLKRRDVEQRKLETARDCSARNPKTERNQISRRSKNLTLARDRDKRQYNHQFVGDLVRCARRWKCGTIRVFGLPSGAQGLLLNEEHLWPWAAFLTMLTESANTFGVKVEEVKQKDMPPEMVEEILSGISSVEQEEADEQEREDKDSCDRAAAAQAEVKPVKHKRTKGPRGLGPGRSGRSGKKRSNGLKEAS